VEAAPASPPSFPPRAAASFTAGPGPRPLAAPRARRRRPSRQLDRVARPGVADEEDTLTWRQTFDASPKELDGLLLFSRRRTLGSRAVLSRAKLVEIQLVVSPDAGDIELREADEDSPPRLAALRDG
jgi:hypothetical protein